MATKAATKPKAKASTKPKPAAKSKEANNWLLKRFAKVVAKVAHPDDEKAETKLRKELRAFEKWEDLKANGAVTTEIMEGALESFFNKYSEA